VGPVQRAASCARSSVGDLTQCEDPGYNAGQMGVNNFGMAFVSNSISDPCDRIYGNTWNGIPPFSESANVGDFITIDPDSLNGSPSSARPTSTGPR
jgi:hypothetical protein